jgi:ActR/RegA family two-component response regulator
LLVEDEVHKRHEIVSCVLDVYGTPPEIVDSVSDAVLRVMEDDFHLIILDMALSTFGESAGDNVKGHDQAQGGIEVLRALKAMNKIAKVIIATQYPDFHIGGTKVKLKDSPKIIKAKYGQDIVGAVLYNYKSKATLQRISSILRQHK